MTIVTGILAFLILLAAMASTLVLYGFNHLYGIIQFAVFFALIIAYFIFSLELMTPSGMVPCEVSELMDFRGAAADRLNPGTEGRVFLSSSVSENTQNAEFAFLVRMDTEKKLRKT